MSRADLMTIKQAADEKGVTTAAIYRRIKDKLFTPEIIAGKPFLRRSEVKRYKPGVGRPRNGSHKARG